MLRLFPLALALLFPSFAQAAETPSRANGDLAIEAREILRKHCSACHTGRPDPGQSKLNVMDYADLIDTNRPVPAVTPGGRAQILELIKDGSMPPGNREGLTVREIGILEKWIAVKAPAYPAAFDDRFTLNAIADDLVGENAKGKFVRYASFAHLIHDGKDLPKLAVEERKLAEAFTLASPGAAVKITPVEPTATLYRIELAKPGWGSRELFNRTDPLAINDAFALRPFDLIHLEYPLATKLPPDDAIAKRLETFLDSRKEMRPVPFVRGDWLSAALAREGKLTPLGEDVKSLVALEVALERGGPKPDGPPVPRFFGTEPLRFARTTADGRALLPPLSACYTGSIMPEPIPFTFTAELVSAGQVVKEVKVDQEFKLRVRATKRVYLTVLTVQADGQVREPPLRDGPIILLANTTRELMPEDRPFSIASILTGGDSGTEYFVVFASEVELPVLRMRSQHLDRPVWRFLASPTDVKFDPNKVVRLVIPIPVRRKK